MNPALLIETTRNGVVEKQHFGFVIVVNKNGDIIKKIGDDKEAPFWMRSAAKPIQASLLLKTGAVEKFGLTKEELAVCCASHSGTQEHTRLVLSILEKISLTENTLQCGIHDPLDKEQRLRMIKEKSSPSPIHNNCSGKHAGMLCVCRAMGWKTKNYLAPEHPLQKMTLEAVAEFCGFSEEMAKNIPIGSDGCGAVVYALPHYKMGVGFINMFLNPYYKILTDSVNKNPFLAGGYGRLDSEVMKASGERIIAKVAAEGLFIAVNLEIAQSLIVKILDADMKARSVASIKVLKMLNWLSEEETLHEGIQKLYIRDILNWKNEPVGKISTKFVI